MFNVRDDLKGLSEQEIQKQYRKNALPGEVLMTHMEGDFNFGSVVRCANAFGFLTVYYYGGKRQWDRRAAVGTHHYIDVFHQTRLDWLDDGDPEHRMKVVALENNVDREVIPLWDYTWDPNSLIVVGEERNGIPEDVLEKADDIVTIPQHGTVRSLNAATAFGIAAFSYYTQIRNNHG
jgi:tRNA G18 (ribose-2'-O)-methylase SpoU